MTLQDFNRLAHPDQVDLINELHRESPLVLTGTQEEICTFKQMSLEFNPYSVTLVTTTIT